MYKGITAHIIAGLGGLDGSPNYDQIPITNLIEAQNIRYDGNSWRKAGGLTLLDSNAISGTPTCLGGFDWHPSSSVQRQITAWSNNKVYKEVSNDVDNVDLLAAAITFSNPVTFVECGQETAGNDKKLLMFSKDSTPRVLSADGAAGSMAAISNPASDWSASNQPSCGLLHDNRVVAWGNENAKHTLYFSTLDDHTDFLTGAPPVYDIAVGEGEYIQSCASLLSTRLYIFKWPTGIYWIDTSDITTLILPVTTIRKDIGLAGQNAITKVGSLGTWFIGNDAHIYSLESFDNPDVDLRDSSITSRLNLTQYIKDNINPAYIKYARLVYDSNRKEVWAMYTQNGSTNNDICIVIDIKDPNVPKISIDDRGHYFNAAWFRTNPTTNYRELMVAGTGGLVYRANQDARVIGTSTTYFGSLRIPDTDFGWANPTAASRIKRFDWLEMSYQVTTSATITIETFIDGEYYQTYSIDLDASGALWDVDEWDVGVWGTAGARRKKIKIGGIGKRFGFKIYNGNDEDFNFIKASIGFMPLGSGGEK